MNDFNKHELHSLLWAIEYVRARTNNCGDSMRRLKPKIQEMIDNYDCKHEWIIQLNDNCIPKSGEICMHCGREKR